MTWKEIFAKLKKNEKKNDDAARNTTSAKAGTRTSWKQAFERAREGR